jgi:hypothetical protein
MQRPKVEIFPSIIDVHSKRWPGKISLAYSVFDGHTTLVQIDKAVKELITVNNPYFVPADYHAPIRCVDGRPLEGYDDKNPTLSHRPLGVQVAGGSSGLAVVYRLTQSWAHENIYFEDDLKTITNILRRTGFEIGGHTDGHHHRNETGCGAIDKVEEIVKSLADPKYIKNIETLTKSLLKERFDAEIYDSVLGKAVRLQSHSSTYFHEGQETLLGKLHRSKNQKNVLEKLTGEHGEEIVIVNFVKGETFHRDRFSARHNHKIQAFNYDIWSTFEVAAKTYSNPIEEMRFVTARVMHTIATLIALTDGSLRLLIRRPS